MTTKMKSTKYITFFLMLAMEARCKSLTNFVNMAKIVGMLCTPCLQFPGLINLEVHSPTWLMRMFMLSPVQVLS